MKFLLGGYSDKGDHRPNNEDSYFIGQLNINADAVFAVVCDGIGGLRNGEIASNAITEHLKTWAESLSHEIDFDELSRCFLEYVYTINSHICDMAKIDAIETGSTMSAFISFNDRYMAANVGDSRIYLINDHVEQLTEDDVVPSSTGRGALRQCVGFNERIYINTYFGEIKKKDTFLICSDGFYKLIDTKRMTKKAALISSFYKPEKLIKDEISRIKKLGEKDNMTACVIRFV